MISEKASLYSEGMKEKYDVGYATKCGIVRPETNTAVEL